MRKKAIFFDRDGVLNRAIIVKGKPKAPKNLDEFKIYNNLEKPFQNLKKKNFLIYVVTNQPDFFKKKKNIVQVMHRRLKKKFPITRILCCFDRENSSKNKKPNTGLVRKMIKKLKINLVNSYVIGDRWRDIDFAYNLKCKSIFIDRNYKENLKKKPNYVCKSTLQAINIVLKNDQNTNISRYSRY